jgi:hypothetical protein
VPEPGRQQPIEMFYERIEVDLDDRIRAVGVPNEAITDLRNAPEMFGVEQVNGRQVSQKNKNPRLSTGVLASEISFYLLTHRSLS